LNRKVETIGRFRWVETGTGGSSEEFCGGFVNHFDADRVTTTNVKSFIWGPGCRTNRPPLLRPSMRKSPPVAHPQNLKPTRSRRVAHPPLAQQTRSHQGQNRRRRYVRLKLKLGLPDLEQAKPLCWLVCDRGSLNAAIRIRSMNLSLVLASAAPGSGNAQGQKRDRACFCTDYGKISPLQAVVLDPIIGLLLLSLGNSIPCKLLTIKVMLERFFRFCCFRHSSALFQCGFFCNQIFGALVAASLLFLLSAFTLCCNASSLVRISSKVRGVLGNISCIS